MATVQQLDRVYVDIPRSVNQLAQLRRAMAEGVLTRSAEGDALAYVLLEDGAEYEHPGKLLFSGVSVDPGTGQVSLRAEFENPDQILLPGMYVRVRLQQGMDEKALLVPQQAIQRTSDGLNSVYVVREGKVQPVAVSVGPQIKGSFLVYKGLNPGDVVVVEGFQKIRPGAAVQPIPWKQAGAKPGSQPGGPAGAQPEPEATPKG